MRLSFKRYDESTIPLLLTSILAKEASSKAEAIRMMSEKNLYPQFGHLNL
jgi:hypothetical protein